MGFVLKVVVLGFAVLLGLFFSGVLFPEPEAPQPEDGWWGRGPPQPETDTSIREFKVQIGDKTLQDLKLRLENSRFGEELKDSQFHYGFPAGELRKITEYWKGEYKWKENEKIINRFTHYKTRIEGIDIHFLHVKPKSGRPGKPILMSHGWPGSFYEFYKILPMLTDPESIGHNADLAFEAVVPSIPGFGFSEAPHRKGFDVIKCAGVYVKLMKRLGYEKFFLQGGDWGSAITTAMALVYPQHTIGLHLNLIPAPNGDPHAMVLELAAKFFPKLVLGEEHAKHFQPTDFGYILEESGYFHIQSTRPDTVGAALNDSPMGLAAYILEKFSVCTNRRNIYKSDGGLTEKFSLDELLTNVMIYWLNGNIMSSVRFYKENAVHLFSSNLPRAPVKVPMAGAIFPQECVPTVPKPFAEYKFKDIVQYSYLKDGGHFAALEEPLILAEDLFSFVTKLEERDGAVH